jgi:tRNA pseudouridine13 synthase
MRQSRFPLEQELGMRYYASDTTGIGGKLRSTADDFLVEEIPVAVGDSGPYIICKLTKKDWELQHAVKELAKRLGISHRRIGWGGTKDRHAITSQLISLYEITPAQIADVRLKDITLEVLGHSQFPLSLGSLKGNRFDIIIRELSGEDIEGQILSVTRTASAGLPNYYGVQRFGVIRPLTHRIGELILKGDYERAVMTYIGQSFPDEPEENRTTRTIYYETRDAREALHHLPVSMSYERSMLHHLVNRPDDYKGALKVLPPKLLSMFVSAFQSWLFNCALSMRFEQGTAIDEPVPGDLLIFENGREDRVTVQNMGIAAQHIKRGRCIIAIFMPGSITVTSGHSGSVIEHLLEEQGIGPDNFGKAQEFVHSRFNGALRPISLMTPVESLQEGDHVRLKFTLPPGHYATTVCREYMKTDPLRMI